jgi:hypothetical protein
MSLPGAITIDDGEDEEAPLRSVSSSDDDTILLGNRGGKRPRTPMETESPMSRSKRLTFPRTTSRRGRSTILTSSSGKTKRTTELLHCASKSAGYCKEASSGGVKATVAGKLNFGCAEAQIQYSGKKSAMPETTSEELRSPAQSYGTKGAWNPDGTPADPNWMKPRSERVPYGTLVNLCKQLWCSNKNSVSSSFWVLTVVSILCILSTSYHVVLSDRTLFFVFLYLLLHAMFSLFYFWPP